MGGDLLKKSRCLTKEKLIFPEFVDNMLTNTLNAAETKFFTLFKTFFISRSKFYIMLICKVPIGKL